MRVRRVGASYALAANSARNAVYYAEGQSPDVRLMRLDLANMETRELFRFPNLPIESGAVSPDERWFVGGPVLVRDSLRSLYRVDLATGATTTLCEMEDMFNPHV